MIEKLLLRIVKCFIYIFSMRWIYVNDLALHYTFDMFLYYLSIAIILSLIVESFDYLISDYIKYTSLIITIILSVFIYMMCYHFSPFYFTVMLYLAVTMIYHLIVSYQMYKDLEMFKLNNNVIKKS